MDPTINMLYFEVIVWLLFLILVALAGIMFVLSIISQRQDKLIQMLSGPNQADDDGASVSKFRIPNPLSQFRK